MKSETKIREEFQPELYCLRCDEMEWDDEARRCANFDGPRCALAVVGLLDPLNIRYLVV